MSSPPIQIVNFIRNPFISLPNTPQPLYYHISYSIQKKLKKWSKYFNHNHSILILTFPFKFLNCPSRTKKSSSFFLNWQFSIGEFFRISFSVSTLYMTHSHSTYCNIIRGYIFENCRTFLFPSSFSSLFWGILMIMSILDPSTRTHDRTSKTYVVDSYLQFLYYLYVITVGTFFLLILTFSFLLYFFFRFYKYFFPWRLSLFSSSSSAPLPSVWSSAPAFYLVSSSLWLVSVRMHWEYVLP